MPQETEIPAPEIELTNTQKTLASLQEEWKEYTLTFVPGENYDAVPDLKCHLLKLQFFTPEKESGKIWLDNVD